MGNLNFLLSYVQACMAGRYPASDCGAVWHLLVIVVMLVLAVSTLVVLRVRSRPQATNA